MRIRHLVLAAFLVLIASNAFADITQDIVNRVTQAMYTDYHSNYLYAHQGNDRDLVSAHHDLARDNIQDLMEGFGLTTFLDPFTYNSNTYYNVVGVHTGVCRQRFGTH